MYKNEDLVRGIGVGSLTAVANISNRPGTEEFTEFFHREALGQVRTASLLLGSVEDANDVVQEAMTRIYERWGDIAMPGPYLNRTVLNLCRDRGRRSTLHDQAQPHLVAIYGETITGSLEPPGARLLDDVLSELPFNQRAAVVLTYWGGMSTSEVAERLECPQGSIGPWLRRGLDRLREALS